MAEPAPSPAPVAEVIPSGIPAPPVVVPEIVPDPLAVTVPMSGSTKTILLIAVVACVAIGFVLYKKSQAVKT